MDLCGTSQEIFPKSKSLFAIFTRNILSKRYDLNHFIVLSTLTFFNQILWTIASNALSFQLTNLRQNLLKLNLLKETTMDLLNDDPKIWLIVM